jgi:hypothetical protein
MPQRPGSGSSSRVGDLVSQNTPQLCSKRGIALAARVVANVYALVPADVLVLIEQVDNDDLDDFVCDQRGSGSTVAITDN